MENINALTKSANVLDTTGYIFQFEHGIKHFKVNLRRPVYEQLVYKARCAIAKR
jgi:hypothetical protein